MSESRTWFACRGISVSESRTWFACRGISVSESLTWLACRGISVSESLTWFACRGVSVAEGSRAVSQWPWGVVHLRPQWRRGAVALVATVSSVALPLGDGGDGVVGGDG